MSAIHDRTVDRWYAVLPDGSMLDWNDSDWSEICWVVRGRTDTRFEELPNYAVAFYRKEDAELALTARQRYRDMVNGLVALEREVSAAYV